MKATRKRKDLKAESRAMPKHTSNTKIALMNHKKKKQLSNEKTEINKIVYRIININRKLTQQKDALPH